MQGRFLILAFGVNGHVEPKEVIYGDWDALPARVVEGRTPVVVFVHHQLLNMLHLWEEECFNRTAIMVIG